MARNLRKPSDAITANAPRGVAISGLAFAPDVIPGVEGTNFYQYSNYEYAYAASKGFDVIRLPFTWNRIQPTLGGDLDTTYKGYIDNAITWASNNGLKILLDLHSYGAYYVSGSELAIDAVDAGAPTTANFVDLWDKLSQTYSDNPTVWGYGIMNEPHDMPEPTTSSNYNTTSTWTGVAQVAIDKIRENDTAKYISVCTDIWSALQRFFTTHGANPTPWWTDSANKLFYEVHCYFTTTYNGTYTGINKHYAGTGLAIRKHGDYLEDIAVWANAHNVKVLVGEVGIPKSDPSFNIALNDFYNVADKYSIPVFYWHQGRKVTDTFTATKLTVPQLEIVTKHTGNLI